MEREVGQTPQTAHISALGEAGVPDELLAVRRMLLRLPRVQCPVGFEYRLQRRLDGKGVSGDRRPVRGWMSGWTGAGLGFAAALVIAVFAFDFNVTGPGTQGTLTDKTAGSATPQLAAPDIHKEQPVIVVEQPVQQLASDKAAATPEKDSARVKHPTSLPDDLYHVVGGSSGH